MVKLIGLLNHRDHPEIEFNFIANMIDAYVTEQDKGSEGSNQDG